MKIVERITLAQIRAAKPKMIYYGALSCWWTHDSAHVGKTPPKSGADTMRYAERLRQNSATPEAPLEEFLQRARDALAYSLPADPRGGVLFQTEDTAGFLRNAEKNAAYYGRHGIKAFLAAHHLNCIVSDAEPRPTCAQTWSEYNDALTDARAHPGTDERLVHSGTDERPARSGEQNSERTGTEATDADSH